MARANAALVRRVIRQFLLLPAFLAAFVYLPAGTLDYWQAWIFSGVFVTVSFAITAWLAMKDPALLERRMKAGPGAETEPAQKVIIVLVQLAFAAIVVVSALDRRFGWSSVPVALVLAGDALVALAYVGFYLVFRENSFGAATVQVVEDQRVISTGPYAVVRHPMYSWALVLIAGIPLALGSWWGLAPIPLVLAALVWRILDEERVLTERLAGYAEYARRVRFRLLPFVW